MSRSSRRPLVDEAIGAVGSLMARRRRTMMAKFCSSNLSIAQIQILSTLAEHESITVGHLAQILGVAAPSASAIVDRMSAGGLIDRVRDDSDRRVVHVSLSPAGRTTFEDMVGLELQKMKDVLNDLSDDELRALVTAVTAVEKAFARRAPSAP